MLLCNRSHLRRHREESVCFCPGSRRSAFKQVGADVESTQRRLHPNPNHGTTQLVLDLGNTQIWFIWSGESMLTCDSEAKCLLFITGRLCFLMPSWELKRDRRQERGKRGGREGEERGEERREERGEGMLLRARLESNTGCCTQDSSRGDPHMHFTSQPFGNCFDKKKESNSHYFVLLCVFLCISLFCCCLLCFFFFLTGCLCKWGSSLKYQSLNNWGELPASTW